MVLIGKATNSGDKASGFTLPADVSEEEMRQIWRQADAAARRATESPVQEQHGTWEELEDA